MTEDRADPPAPPARAGPRPLLLHLAAAMALWTACSAGSTISSAASPRWRLPKPPPEDAPQDPRAGLRADLKAAADAAAALGRLQPEVAAAALAKAIGDDATAFLAGIARYRAHPYRRRLDPPPIIWRRGTTVLRDHRPAGGPAVLVIPSLVNRAYVLDLDARTSLLRALAGAGLRPLLVEWDAPAPDEAGLTLADIVTDRLDGALHAARDAAGGPVGLIGYCMGGTLAVALATRRPQDVAALACLAAPWDFHAARPPQMIEGCRLLAAALPALLDRGCLPVDVIQAGFMALDPLSALRKFRLLARMDAEDPRIEPFVALEDWLNDGIPLPGPIAAECLSGWYVENAPAAGAWRIGGTAIRPDAIACPSLHMIPAQDRIVPPDSAGALAAATPGAERLDLPLGHIGMAVSARAPALAWAPLARWLGARLDGPSHAGVGAPPVARRKGRPYRSKAAGPSRPARHGESG